ncbi:MAG: vWA domain-containing protein [Lachnospiraceae bacterium]
MGAGLLACSAVETVCAEKVTDSTQSIAQSAPELETAAENCAEGLELRKGAFSNDDGTYSVRLEAYVTGTETTTYQPFDAVVVADCSGSMNYMFGTEKTRETVMKTALGGFLDNMASFNKKLPSDTQSRFALVQFSDAGSGDGSNRTKVVQDFTEVEESNVNSLKSEVQNLECKAGTHTRTDAGMECAKQLVAQDGLDRKKVVVLVTDGQPNDREGFQPSVANRAIAAAKAVKEAGAEVFVISMEPSCVAVPGETFPTYEKLPEDNPETNADWQNFFYVSDEGNLAQYPKNTEPENMKNMTNRFMYLVSSDNPHALDMDTPNEKDESDGGKTMAQGFSYYSSPENPEQFLQLFDQLAKRAGKSDQQLGKDAVLFDEVAEDFVLCDSPEAAAYTSALKADGTWQDPVPAEGVSIRCDSEKNTVSVTGFDYSANYVTKNGHVDKPGFYGSKLIVTFRIRPLATFGGNGLPTNTGRSGVYPDGGLENPTGLFPIPKVDIPLSYEIDGRDKNVFAPDDVTLPELVKYKKGFVPDGADNRHVSITYDICDSAGNVLQTMEIPAGKTSEEVRFGDPKAEVPKTCAKYTIRCTVTPVADGTQKALTRKKTQAVHYFVPTVDLKDTVEKKGDAIDTGTGDLLSGEGLGAHLAGAAWTCSDGTKADEKSAPALSYHVSALSGVAVQNGTEVLTAEDAAAFDVRVFRASEGASSEEITDLSTLTHSCEKADCSFASVREREPQADFLIHIEAADEKKETEEKENSTENNNTSSSSGTGGAAQSDAAADADADGKAESSASVTNNVTIQNSITVPSGSTGTVQSASSPTPASSASSSDAVQEANKKAAEATLQANLKAAEDAQNAILEAQQNAAQSPASAESSVTAVSSGTPAASSAQVITDRPKTGEAGDSDLFVPIAAAAGAVFFVLVLCFARRMTAERRA